MSSLPTAEVVDPRIGSGDDLRATRLLIDEVQKATRDANLVLQSDASLTEKDQVVRLALQQPLSDEAAWLVDQRLSLAMIQQLLQAPEADQEMIGVYVERLVERNNPNADLITEGLKQVRGHWNETHITSLAFQSQEAALDYLRDQCADCIDALMIFKSEMDIELKERLDARTSAIMDALPTLKELIES